MIVSNAINWNSDPIIYDFGFLALRWYSMCFVVGFSYGFYYVRKLFRADGIKDEAMDKLLMYVVIATIFGARLGHVLFYDIDILLNNPIEAFLPISFENGFEFIGFRGLASHGGAIALLIALYLFSKKIVKKPLHWIFDRISPVIAFAGAFIRLGNFMNSEIIGNPTGSDYGVIFERIDLIPRHPAQLYESIGYLFIYFVLNAMIKRDKLKKPWSVFSMFLILLFGVRFIIEFFKNSQGGFEKSLELLSTGQWLSIPFILLGLFLMSKGDKFSKI